MLQLEGFTTRWFSRGLPMLEAVARQQPDLVILDGGLPDINGFYLQAALAAIMAMTRHIDWYRLSATQDVNGLSEKEGQPRQ